MTETNPQGEQGTSRNEQSELVAELNRLGENLGKLLKATWESEERKTVEHELKSGLEQFTKQINTAVEQARTDQNVKKAKETLKEAWHTAHGPQVVSEMHMGLVDSLKKLNDEIAKRAEPKPAHEVKADGVSEKPPAEEVKPE
jgi:ElaB/YqjD/DUF883 family membrane-anchored ribosome-binding protein